MEVVSLWFMGLHFFWGKRKKIELRGLMGDFMASTFGKEMVLGEINPKIKLNIVDLPHPE